MSEWEAQDQSWYLARDGQQLGPFAGLELLRLAEAGQVRASDLVWKPGFADWQPISALAAAFAPQPNGNGVRQRRQPTEPAAPEQSTEASLALEQSTEAIEVAPEMSAAIEEAPSVADQTGELGQWINRIPLRFARNAAIIGAIPGLLIGFILGLSYLFEIVIGFILAALVAGFLARVYLRRLELSDEITAIAAGKGLPLRYAAAAALIGLFILALELAQKLASGSYSPEGGAPVILTFVMGALVCAAIGFGIGLVHRNAIVDRLLPA
jgi:hypothetical protein